MVAIALETYSFRTAVKESAHAKGGATWWQFVRRAKVPEMPVVLLEDLGALVGLVFALASVDLASLPGRVNAVEAGIRAAVPAARVIYVEPDVLGPSPS